MLAEELAHFYPDLSDPEYKTAIAVFHQRYSTNTFPTWDGHSPSASSVTTARSTRCRATKTGCVRVRPTWPAPSGMTRRHICARLWRARAATAASLDNVLELLVRSGRDIRHAIMMMIPEAWERMPEGEVTPERAPSTNITAR
jgi:glutamate synthase (ferredoxin)